MRRLTYACALPIMLAGVAPQASAHAQHLDSARLVLAEVERARVPVRETFQALRLDALSPRIPTCREIPTDSAVKTGRLGYQDRYYSARDALKLGIPLANARTNRDYLVIVRDYLRAAECIATDGQTKLVYGQVVRAVIEVLEYDAALGLNLPIIAANGTLNRKMQFFYLYKNGIYHPRIDSIIASVSGKAFDVENYALYQSVMPQMIELMSDATTQRAVVLIEVIPPPDNRQFETASAVAFALSRIAKGHSCAEAQNKFAKDVVRADAVRATYVLIMNTCDSTKPSERERIDAREMLADVKVN